MLHIYSLLMAVLLPWFVLRLYWRARGQRRVRLGELAQRLGYSGAERATVDIWLHAVSVGEAKLALRLSQALWQQNPDLRLLITCTTDTGLSVVQKQTSARLLFSYSPYDLPAVSRRFLQRHRPRLVLIIETELWPNMLANLGRSKVPVCLVNARMSSRSMRRYQRIPQHARLCFQPLSKVYAQWQADAERLQQLGVAREKLEVVGSLKLDESSPQGTNNLHAQLGALDASEALITFASTQPGEEKKLQTLIEQLCQMQHTRVVLVPRHPHRAPELTKLLQSCQPQLFSQMPSAQPWRLLIVDAIGVLGDFYAISQIAVIGGSFVAHGGQNMIEAIDRGVPTLIGPSDRNFLEVSKMLVAAGALLQVRDPQELQSQLQRLLASPEQRARMARAGRNFLHSYKGLYDRLAHDLLKFL